MHQTDIWGRAVQVEGTASAKTQRQERVPLVQRELSHWGWGKVGRDKVTEQGSELGGLCRPLKEL